MQATAVESMAGSSGLRLRVSRLPSKPETCGPFLQPVTVAPDSGSSIIQLIEGEEYRYEWLGLLPPHLVTEPREIFNPDDSTGRSGRLRPALAVGFVEVGVFAETSQCATLEIEVRSKKLSFDDEYRWMLNDIAAHMTELVMERFAASELVFEQDASRDSVTSYQRFEFLQALLKSERFQLGMHEIFRSPHVGWEEHLEEVELARGLPGGGAVARQLAKIGVRPGNVAALRGRLPHLQRRRTDSTLDTVPNRFVKFALVQWQQVLGQLEEALSKPQGSPAMGRGLRELRSAQAEIEDLLRRELFVEVGQLDRFPTDNQVLQKREGYRDVFRAYIDSELAAMLSWAGSSIAYRAGSHDAATLYEYWAFIQLATSVAQVVGETFDLTVLLKRASNGLSIDLDRGRQKVISGKTIRFGRPLSISLYFNRTYAAQKESWTRQMRPDYSLVIAPEAGEHGPIEPVIVHFDAKYRVEFSTELLGSPDEVVGIEIPDSDVRRGGARRDDLLKMHAYRDAIRRTAGAYVLYPGGDAEISQKPFTEYHELLPGLGAFVLRPTDTGEPTGKTQLLQFLDDVIEHLARRLTEHERSRYWLEEVFGRSEKASAPPASTPPRAATVLLGFVKSSSHFAWIRNTKTYNVRAPGRPGGTDPDSVLMHSQLLLLYCPATSEVQLARILSDPQYVSSEALKAIGYPSPGGPRYLCVQIGFVQNPGWTSGVSANLISELLHERGVVYGAPEMIAWGELMDRAKRPSP